MKLKNNALQELYDALVNSTITISPYVDSPVDKAFKECDNKLSESITFECLAHLQDRNDILEKSNGALLSANLYLDTKKKELEDKIKRLESNVKVERKSRDYWMGKCIDKNRIVAERDKLRNRVESLEKAVSDREELHKDRDRYFGLYTELRKDYDKLFEDNRKFKARTDCLREEVKWYRKHYKEKDDKIKELKSRLNSIPVNATAFEHGQKDLWDMLQNVKDSQPNEFDVECECLGDVIDMDLEDFLDAYKKWWEEKEKDRLNHMRDYLDRFCRGKECFKCGRGYGFVRFGDNDDLIVPDKDLPRYYEKATGSGRYKQKPISTDIASTYPGELVITTRGVATADCSETTINTIKEAVRTFEKSLPALDSWEATITGSIKADDILGL